MIVPVIHILPIAMRQVASATSSVVATLFMGLWAIKEVWKFSTLQRIINEGLGGQLDIPIRFD